MTYLQHGGKWGYTNGVRNGNKTAGSAVGPNPSKIVKVAVSNDRSKMTKSPVGVSPIDIANIAVERGIGKNSQGVTVDVQQLKDSAKKADEIVNAKLNVGSDQNTPPKEYQPTLKPSSHFQKQGFVDEKGVLYVGGKEKARADKYKDDLKEAQEKIGKTKKEQTSPTTKVTNIATDIIDKGKNFIDSIFKSKSNTDYTYSTSQDKNGVGITTIRK